MQAENEQSSAHSVQALDPPPVDAHSLQPAFQVQFHGNNVSLHGIDTTSLPTLPTIDSSCAQTPTPLSAGLRLQTDVPAKFQLSYPTPYNTTVEQFPQQNAPTTGLPVRSSSVRSILSASHHRRSSLSPASVVSSPGIGPIIDITPLPSPIVNWGSPGPWKRIRESREMQDTVSEAGDIPSYTSKSQESFDSSHLSPKKQKDQVDYKPSPVGRDAQIYNINASAHARNRSLSASFSNILQAPRSPSIVAADSRYFLHDGIVSPTENHLHREEYLAVKRGLTLPISKPLTPPRSSRDTDGSDVGSAPSSPPAPKKKSVFYEARTIRGGEMRRWREIGYLGGGAFSTVMLAMSIKGGNVNLDPSAGGLFDSPNDVRLDPRSLVAVKICEHGPAGGADEQRVEISLERELDILKSIDHPCLAHLKAVSILDQRAFLILSYCPGGDLYLLASTKPELLIPSLIRRIFAELISAVRYLHSQYIVHRDIKLENVLVNIKADAISTITDWQSFPSPIITLTDLGLGRRIPQPPESPLLETRCGSEDYAAPEIILGQQYDGRATDAWALGVLLYALLENRLPFDELPSTRKGSHKTHRIARCDWAWVRWANDEKNQDSVTGKAFEGARGVVEGLLAKARLRWGLEKVEETEWVGGCMVLERPLRRTSDEDEHGP